MGAFVAAYSALSFRLVSEPFSLSLGAAGLVFLVHPVGTLGSSIFGSITGVVWHLDGWPAVMTLVLTLCGIVVVLALLVRRTKSLVEGQR